MSDPSVAKDHMTAYGRDWKLHMKRETTEEAPCRQTCPAGIDVPRYIRLISDGRFDDALAVNRETVPFPGVLGRVCFSPCESKCILNTVESPIVIRSLKRFVADRDAGAWRRHSVKKPETGKKTAIIGSGPAGLTAGYYLAKSGHSVTVFEALSCAGGMMRVGIPDYRLPKDVLDAEIDIIKESGVRIVLNSRIDSIDSLFEKGFDAVFLALGAHRGKKMQINGEDCDRVVDGAAFLRDINLGADVNLGKHVTVVGGGNTAIDAARTAIRLGTKQQVKIIYRRSRDEMPASNEEIETAIEEGIDIIYLANPTSIIRQNNKIRLDCIRMKLEKPDDSGRKKPVPVQGSEFSIDADNIIMAIGQTPAIPENFKLQTDSNNIVHVNTNTLATERQGVWAGGDLIAGPDSVIDAIADGRKAAVSIDKFLGGNGDISEELTASESYVEPFPDTPFGPWAPVTGRSEAPKISVEKRINNFDEVELAFDEETAILQSKHCLRCDLPIYLDSTKCCGCLICEMRCSLRNGGSFNAGNSHIKVYRLGRSDTEYGHYFTDECDMCGICARYCPNGALTRKKENRG